MTAIIDTSFLYALVDKGDRNHERVLDVAQALDETLILPIVVLPEICYLIASRVGHHAMRRFLAELSGGEIVLEGLSLADLSRIIQILEQYSDSQLDFVDSSIVAIAERLDVVRVLTLDRRDFGMVVPEHARHFDILP